MAANQIFMYKFVVKFFGDNSYDSLLDSELKAILRFKRKDA